MTTTLDLASRSSSARYSINIVVYLFGDDVQQDAESGADDFQRGSALPVWLTARRVRGYTASRGGVEAIVLAHR
jgi:hypothetical protein